MDKITSPFKLQILHMIEALLGCNEMAFLNIALEWLRDHQHNSCYYSFGTHNPFFIVPGPLCYHRGTQSEPTVLVSLLVRMWPFPPPGAIYAVLIDHRNHSADSWKVWGVTGDFQRRPSREQVLPQSRGGATSGLCNYTTGSQTPPSRNDLSGNIHHTEKLYISGTKWSLVI